MVLAILNVTINSIFSILLTRLVKAIAIPSYSSLSKMTILLCIYGLVAIPWGLKTNFLRWDICKSKQLIFKITATSLIAPALIEEIFFRVSLLPYPLEQIQPNSWFAWSLLSLFCFIIYHPLNAFTFFPQGKETFSNPVFLCLATGLGIIYTLTYWQSGSLWLPVFVHWLVVVIWLLCWGGLSKLNFK
ncbi:CPBP family glutamic-type intramembrane protease [Pleurocapsa sp. FMAR1]|uniref:CPBP family glutamic-type intramembrane protease n=1 Tax=Pleurocapsa sp. FMAR1 TaxID=3040204 RepID=UPI0029C8D95A|nr:CPBP family glutamic-type intramembrane protease [Pleurocapsa sp. FMAR1]